MDDRRQSCRKRAIGAYSTVARQKITFSLFAVTECHLVIRHCAVQVFCACELGLQKLGWRSNGLGLPQLI